MTFGVDHDTEILLWLRSRASISTIGLSSAGDIKEENLSLLFFTYPSFLYDKNESVCMSVFMYVCIQISQILYVTYGLSTGLQGTIWFKNR